MSGRDHKNKFPAFLKLLLWFKERTEYELSDVRGDMYGLARFNPSVGRVRNRPFEGKK